MSVIVTRRRLLAGGHTGPHDAMRCIAERRCIEPDCITFLCYLNPGPRCFIHTAKFKGPRRIPEQGTPEWCEQQDRAIEELLKLPPGWEAKAA